jgi:hypothetical protein
MSEIIDAIRTCGNMAKDCSECPYTNGYTDICDYICDNRSELSLMLKHHEEHDSLVAEVEAMRLVYNGVEKIALVLQSRTEKAEAEVERLKCKIRKHEIFWICERCVGVVDGIHVECTVESCKHERELKELEEKDGEG